MKRNKLKALALTLSMLTLVFHSGSSWASSSYMNSGNGGYNLSNQYRGPIVKKEKAKDSYRKYIAFKFHSIIDNSASDSLKNKITGTKIPITSEYENNYGFALSYGSKTKFKNISIEAEVSYDAYPVENISGASFLFNKDFELINGMVNGYYHLNNKSFLTPYIGIGGGFSVLKRTDDFGFAYQAMVGVDWDIAPRYTIMLGYKYMGTTKFESELVNNIGQPVEEKISMQSSIIQLGLKYRF